MTICRKCGWYYKDITDWLQHKKGHRDGRITRKYWRKKPHSVQNTTSRNDRKENS